MSKVRGCSPRALPTPDCSDRDRLVAIVREMIDLLAEIQPLSLHAQTCGHAETGMMLERESKDTYDALRAAVEMLVCHRREHGC